MIKRRTSYYDNCARAWGNAITFLETHHNMDFKQAVHYLRILETVEAGDGITATLPDGSKYTYIVTQVQAFENSADLKMSALDGKSIALITCYPFRYSGSAPGKYLVIGQLDAEAAD